MPILPTNSRFLMKVTIATLSPLLLAILIACCALALRAERPYRHHAYWCLTPNIGYPMGLPCRYARNPEKSI